MIQHLAVTKIDILLRVGLIRLVISVGNSSFNFIVSAGGVCFDRGLDLLYFTCLASGNEVIHSVAHEAHVTHAHMRDEICSVDDIVDAEVFFVRKLGGVVAAAFRSRKSICEEL